MNPDMRRLCEAAVRSSGTLEIDYHAGYAPTEDPAGWEDIVRAVLTELRNVSVPMYKAGGTATVHGGPYGEYNVEVGEDAALAAFIDMIDFILAEPATT